MAERTNEEKLELFADLLEPAAVLIGDKELRDIINRGEPKIRAAAAAIRNHKSEVITILARMDDVPVEEYRVNLLALPVKLVRLLNKTEIKELFTGAEQMNDAEFSGSATEITGDGVN